ncbi:4-hydroxy-3-methylbut-2-enyl diphosphate reductase [Desertimonas flava]|jgi:4-hydroxy-3-methylbut-2-enyl diphosphate reductase|uniref:4-hydroxy-3-methylbut-2-enyl diphosphate reductase n=1 Tax=Desertimonas flava TaxID=2064846 RepID=UPI000E343DE6|nr:4-hydroxy-3-methylbut-2-enyl diphosphate reductase [Desertimonas flava]
MGDRRLTVLAPMRIEHVAIKRGATSATVLRTGMGPAKASAFAAGEGRRRIDPAGPIAVVGVAGALSDDLKPGDIIVADSLVSTDGKISVDLPGAPLVASALAAAGITSRIGPLSCAHVIIKGDARDKLAASGAIAVEMESAWLADGLGATEGGRPFAVVRVIIDTPSHELFSRHTIRNFRMVLGKLASVVAPLERWAEACGDRDILLAGPRSFCAGVERAIEIVERAIDRFGAPVYVRRQIVHNSHVVADLERRGAVFVEELDEVPPGATVVLAAHGVSPMVRSEADARGLQVIDATCPLVSKVHSEARRFADRDFDIVLIGHDDHEEVIGTIGEAPGRISVVASAEDVDRLAVRDPDRVAYLTQTTLAVDEADGIVQRLRERFPNLAGPRREDICYATQNRQEAVTAIAAESDVLFVVGSANSSNSRRLVEVAERRGVRAHLVDGPDGLDVAWLEKAVSVGISAGASAPESKVQEVVAAIASLGPVTVTERTVVVEDVSFPLPSLVK